MKLVLGINDSFVSCYMNDMALFQIEFHIPVVCPFIKFIKYFREHSCVCLTVSSEEQMVEVINGVVLLSHSVAPLLHNNTFRLHLAKVHRKEY